MTEEDEWVHVAFNDDTLVVELLLNLSQPEQPPPPPRRRRRRRFAGDLAKEGAVLALSVDWSVRQRRSSSRQVMMTKSKKGSDSSSSRASPTTPLSFSGGTSVSGGGGGAGDGFDEATTSASLPAKLIATSRSKNPMLVAEVVSFNWSRPRRAVWSSSKVEAARAAVFMGGVSPWQKSIWLVAVTRETPAIKRSRKKKKLVDLREEEILLLKEKRHLKNKLATFQASLEEERVRNERLKRMKFDLLSQHRPEVFTAAVNSEIISIQPRDTKVACDSTYSIVPHNVSFQLQEGEDRKSSFILPDLNLPVEGDSSSGILV
ncbi:hypothetical protein OIU77_016476 [Salix suchowensis]|uniref:Uncharacterized protein n=1 Tax=Salix suchowensis TaxID=1278906 RepID=A0ABQ8ZKQ0_9ROSI|nr:hypothetical protein OIU77_016476 [Salix suchowensis]